MDSKSLYQQLLDYEPLGFIDPFNDLGTYDALQKSFKEPISDLLNPYSGHPYSKAWQKKIAAMRELYIAYQMSIGDTTKTYKRGEEDKAALDRTVSTYLRLGWRFGEIIKRLDYSEGHLRNRWSRNELMQLNQPEFFLKSDLTDGYFTPIHHFVEDKR